MVIERIYCGIQNYAWGKVGASSKVAQLATNADNNFRFATVIVLRTLLIDNYLVLVIVRHMLSYGWELIQKLLPDWREMNKNYLISYLLNQSDLEML